MNSTVLLGFVGVFVIGGRSAFIVLNSVLLATRSFSKMVELNIMQETKPGYFSPNKKVTRGELALYISRLEQYFEEEAAMLTNNMSFNTPGSLIDYLYGEPVMNQQIYIDAPINAVRSTIANTFTFGR